MSMTTQAAPGTASPGAFVRFTDAVSRITGSSFATLLAAASMLVWLCSGPLFHFSVTWHLVVNTGTTPNPKRSPCGSVTARATPASTPISHGSSARAPAGARSTHIAMHAQP